MRFPTNSVLVSTVVLAALGAGCTQSPGAGEAEARVSGTTVPLRAIQNESNGSIAIYREGEDEPIITQNAAPGHRPFLHPIVAPDGRGLATQSSPDHHPHQTGLYWGFTRVNGEPMDEDTLQAVVLSARQAGGHRQSGRPGLLPQPRQRLLAPRFCHGGHRVRGRGEVADRPTACSTPKATPS